LVLFTIIEGCAVNKTRKKRHNSSTVHRYIPLVGGEWMGLRQSAREDVLG